MWGLVVRRGNGSVGCVVMASFQDSEQERTDG